MRLGVVEMCFCAGVLPPRYLQVNCGMLTHSQPTTQHTSHTQRHSDGVLGLRTPLSTNCLSRRRLGGIITLTELSVGSPFFSNSKIDSYMK